MKAEIKSSRPRRVVTSLHGGGMHLCGIQPKPSEERVSLRQDFHPGFGFLALQCGGKEVWTAVRDEDSRTLSWLERHVIDGNIPKSPGGTWTLHVNSPMVSYVITRRRKNVWVLTESGDGFA